jgi:hypothetical protein
MKQNFTALDYANGLRALADFYEAHPEMPLPYPQVHVFMHDREPFLAAVKDLADGGKVAKESDDNHTEWPSFHAIRMFGPIKLDVSAIFECPDSLLEEAAEFEER